MSLQFACCVETIALKFVMVKCTGIGIKSRANKTFELKCGGNTFFNRCEFHSASSQQTSRGLMSWPMQVSWDIGVENGLSDLAPKTWSLWWQESFGLCLLNIWPSICEVNLFTFDIFFRFWCCSHQIPCVLEFSKSQFVS